MKRRILIVDDSQFMRRIIKSIIENTDYEVCGEANDGKEGYLLYQQLKPDMVTLDITMPECNGLECLQKIIDYDSKAKVIMCSAMGQKIMVMEAMKIGAKDFVIKPFQKERVIETLKKLSM